MVPKRLNRTHCKEELECAVWTMNTDWPRKLKAQGWLRRLRERPCHTLLLRWTPDKPGVKLGQPTWISLQFCMQTLGRPVGPTSTHVNKWHPAATTLHPTAVTGIHTQQTPSTCCCTGDPICRQWHPASPVVLTTGYWCSSKHVACSALGTFTLHHLCHHSLPHTGLVETPCPPHRFLWPVTSSETL